MNTAHQNQVFVMLVACALLFAGPLWAGEWQGQVALENTGFARTGSADQHNQVYSFMVEPEYYHTWDNHQQSLTVKAFYRYDSRDSERTHWDIRELTWLHASQKLEWRLGVRKVFWGVTESFHLVDIINQTDLVENLDGEEKLGQPMINLAWINAWGTVDVFLLTGFRERTFPGRDGRLRSSLAVDSERAAYESGAAEHHLDGAVRYQHSLGAWDLGLAHFHGTSREPLFRPIVAADGDVALQPYYPQIDQTSLDLQGTFGSWLLKLEGAYRAGFGETDYAAAVAGFEYTFFDVRGSGLDIGVLAEYLYDERAELAGQPFADDWFIGSRWAWNDTAGSELLVGLVFDPDNGGRFWNLEANRRLSDQLKVSLELRNFSHTRTEELLHSFARDDHFRVNLAYYF